MGLSSISSLHVTKTAGEILFDGYEEPILSTLSLIPMLNVQDRFGIFYGVSVHVSKWVSKFSDHTPIMFYLFFFINYVELKIMFQ